MERDHLGDEKLDGRMMIIFYVHVTVHRNNFFL